MGATWLRKFFLKKCPPAARVVASALGLLFPDAMSVGRYRDIRYIIFYYAIDVIFFAMLCSS